MKNRLMVVLALAMALPCTSVTAASFPSSVMRDSLVSADSLGRLCVGVDYEFIDREINVDFGGAEALREFEANCIDGFISVDITPWLTPFVTLGASTVEDSDSGLDGDYKFKWSAGLSFNIWHYDVMSPEFLAGRLSIESAVEYGQYASENVGFDGSEVTWSETTLMFPICYEVFEDQSPMEDKSLQQSLNLYAGPVLSFMDGTIESGFGDADFEQDQEFGFIGGADIFFAERLSIGGHVLVFGSSSPSMGANLRFHF